MIGSLDVKMRNAMIGSNRFAGLRVTPVYDAYWRFAAERQEILHKRISGIDGPWTNDPILKAYRFTNAYRAADRVSQYLIREVIHGKDHDPSAEEVVFRTLLFKLFNKIETWEVLTSQLGTIHTTEFDPDRYGNVLTKIIKNGGKIYSGAYIMPPVRLSDTTGVKHVGHLALLQLMLKHNIAERLASSGSLSEMFAIMTSYPSIGPFLGFQLAIDINYSDLVMHDEAEFVVAGPGALDGISKCFENASDYVPSDIIEFVQNRQDLEFERLGLTFRRLGNRPLQLIDCQNLFCEISKYSRVSHPEFPGVAGRTRIKQSFRQQGTLPPLFLPPKWSRRSEKNG